MFNPTLRVAVALFASCLCACHASPADPDASASDAATDGGPAYQYFYGTVTATQAQRICALDVSCGSYFITQAADAEGSTGTCATVLTSLVPAHLIQGVPSSVIQCGLSATRCDQFLLCVGGGYTAAACSASSAGFCDGDIAVKCPSLSTGDPARPASSAIDCAAQGLSCALAGGTINSAYCTAGACTAPVGSAAPTHCVGNVSQTCNGLGQLTAQDCSTLSAGAICQEGRGCVDGTLPSCTGDSSQCSGNHAIGCESGRQVDFDCAVAIRGGVCTPAAGGNSATCRTGATTECNPFGPMEQCNGAMIHTCINGHYADVDCTAAGFSSCVLNPRGDYPICAN